MADNEEESVGSNNEDQIVEDLLSQLKQFEEKSKKCLEELDEERDLEANVPALIKNDELMFEVAEWAKEIAKPQLRAAVIEAFEGDQELSIDFAFTAIEMLIDAFKDYVKVHRNAYTFDELFNKLSEIAQQVIDLKDP